MENFFLTGLIAAPFTPMNPDGTINLDMISSYADLLIEQGVSGAFICGTTGEGAAMSISEKKAVIEEWVHCSKGRLKIIAHIGGLCQSESIELAAHSVKAGVDAVAAMSPYFYKPLSAEDLTLFFIPVAAEANGIPFYYYHIPSMTGVDLPVYEILKVAEKMIPNFAGVKFTHSNMMELQQCMKISEERYEILFGSDEILLCGLSFGVTSAVGSTYNYMASIYLDLIEAFNSNDFTTARANQLFSVEVVEVLNRNGGPLSAGKAIMEMIGIDCGPCRLPIRKMTKAEKASLRQELLNIGFFEESKHEFVEAR